MARFIQIICDYERIGDLAWSEIVSVLNDLVPPDTRIIQTVVPSFDTVSLGFCLAQLALRPRRPGTGRGVYFGNCAPRKDKTTARSDNEGEGLLYAELENGEELLVVNSGYSLSFVKPHIKKLHVTVAPSKGSQFRSRDYFPEPVANCLNGDAPFLAEALPLSVIPDAPLSVVAYVDSFKNIKTSIRVGDSALAEFAVGDRIKVGVGGIYHEAFFTDGSFSLPEGVIAFSPGSSGYDRRFYEIFIRHGEAATLFQAAAGRPVTILKDNSR